MNCSKCGRPTIENQAYCTECNNILNQEEVYRGFKKGLSCDDQKNGMSKMVDNKQPSCLRCGSKSLRMYAGNNVQCMDCGVIFVLPHDQPQQGNPPLKTLTQKMETSRVSSQEEYDQIIGQLKAVRNDIDSAKARGVNVVPAERILQNVRPMLKRRDFDRVYEYMEKTKDVLNQAVKAYEKKNHPVVEGEEKKVGGKAAEDTGEPPEIEWRTTYISKEKKPRRAFKLFKELTKRGSQGLCISRVHPQKIKRIYHLENTDNRWLSKKMEKFCISPTPEKLQHEINQFIRRKGKDKKTKLVILVDGLEYLISNNEFKKALRFIDDLKETVVVNNAILILPISPETYSVKELTLLEKSTIEITMPVIKNADLFFKAPESEGDKTDDGSTGSPSTDGPDEDYGKEVMSKIAKIKSMIEQKQNDGGGGDIPKPETDDGGQGSKVSKDTDE